MKHQAEKMQRMLTAAALSLLLCGTGCFGHKPVRTITLPQAKVPVMAEAPPEPDPPPLLDTPEQTEEEIPIAAAAATPRRVVRRRPAPAKTTVAPTDAAGNVGSAPGPATEAGAAGPMPEEDAIGELSAGGDSTPQVQQEASEIISSNEKRISALPADVLRSKRSQISKIRNFQRQASEALKSGDAEGAKTLATKARVLLYDLDRSGGGE